MAMVDASDVVKVGVDKKRCTVTEMPVRMVKDGWVLTDYLHLIHQEIEADESNKADDGHFDTFRRAEPGQCVYCRGRWGGRLLGLS